MKVSTLIAASTLAALAVTASPATFARSKAQLDASAVRTLKHFYALNPANHELAEKAAGMLVFGRITKAGAGVAGEFGEGELRVHGAPVNYYSMSSASLGLTLGVAHHSEILMFMTPESLDKFIKSDGWSVGADTAVAVVKSGSAGQYDTETLSKPILGFVFHEKGLIGDVSLEGAKITKIKSDN